MVFERQEPGQWKAGALALLVHALFLGLMIFGVSWHNNEPAAVEVELWSALPSPASKPVPPRPEPEPKIEPKPEPKPKVAKPEVAKPEPQPEVKPDNRAEIELKAKEARRKEKEEEQKKFKEAELKQKEKLKQELEKREQDKKLQQDKAEKLREQQAQADAEKALKAQTAARNTAAQKVVGDFKSRIQAKIKSKIILPPDLAGNPAAEFDVTLMPTGEVLNLKLTRSSGSGAYDSAVERAIYKAQPLPLPPDPTLFSEFRELHLKFRLNED